MRVDAPEDRAELIKLLKLLADAFKQLVDASKLVLDRAFTLLGFLLMRWLENHQTMNAALPAAPLEKLLTVREAAQFLSVTIRTIHNYKRQGKLKACYVNKEPRFERQQLEAWLQRKEMQK